MHTYIYVTGFWKTYHLHTRDIRKIITSISTTNITVVKQLDKSVRDTLNYQIYCRNTLDLTMGLSCKAANIEIVIISLV